MIRKRSCWLSLIGFIGVVVACLTLLACSVREGAPDIARGGLWTPLFPSMSELRIEQGRLLERWIGKTKGERVRIRGAPEQCAMVSSGEEICQWRDFQAHDGTSATSLLVFTYTAGVATDWSFQTDRLRGSFTRADWLRWQRPMESSTMP